MSEGAVTLEAIRARILGRARESKEHREPFSYAGRSYRFRLPSRVVCGHCFTEAGRNMPYFYGLLALHLLVGSDDAQVLRPEDISALLEEGPGGFLDAFADAVGPFLMAPPSIEHLYRRSRPAPEPPKESP